MASNERPALRIRLAAKPRLIESPNRSCCGSARRVVSAQPATNDVSLRILIEVLFLMTHRRQWRDYRTASGRRPLREYLLNLTDVDRAAVLDAMRAVAMDGLRAARHLRGEIWEVRATGENRIYRVLFAAEGRFGQVLLSLETFAKKSQKTPPGKVALAERRLREWRARGVAGGRES